VILFYRCKPNSEGVELLYLAEKIDNTNPERVALLYRKDDDAMKP
jgi:hypothetical protein